MLASICADVTPSSYIFRSRSLTDLPPLQVDCRYEGLQLATIMIRRMLKKACSAPFVNDCSPVEAPLQIAAPDLSPAHRLSLMMSSLQVDFCKVRLTVATIMILSELH